MEILKSVAPNLTICQVYGIGFATFFLPLPAVDKLQMI